MNFIQYIKQVWKAGTSGGTPLSPDRLNHMEDGIKNNNDMISELNNNLTFGAISNITDINFDSSIFPQKKKIYIHELAIANTKEAKGFPEGCYGYGLLITIKYTYNYTSVQIIIPHHTTNNSVNYIYVRTFGDVESGSAVWRKINADDIVKAI